MSKTNDMDNDFSKLQSEFKELREDVNKFIKGVADDSKGKAQDAIHDMGEEGKKMFEAVFAKPQNPILHEFQKRPIISTVALLAIGILSVRTFVK